MPTLVSHSPQELATLYGQLSSRQQDELFVYLRQLIAKEQLQQENCTANDDLLALAGSMKTDIHLSDDELDEAIHRSYYVRDGQ